MPSPSSSSFAVSRGRALSFARIRSFVFDSLYYHEYQWRQFTARIERAGGVRARRRGDGPRETREARSRARRARTAPVAVWRGLF